MPPNGGSQSDAPRSGARLKPNVSCQVNALLALCLFAMLGFTDIAIAACDSDAPNAHDRFSRQHKVHNFNGDEPFTATDELKMWQTPDGTRCFSLLTVGTNGHECSATGELRKAGRKGFRYEDKACTLTFVSERNRVTLNVSPGWSRGGSCPRQMACGMFGSVEPGTFK